MDRELTMEFARVTEAAAIAAAKWMGTGKKNEADQAATTAMRAVFDTVDIDGTVVIGEGEMDEAPMLYIGEKLGCGKTPVDVAVDPLEGTNIVAKGLWNAITVIAVAPTGTLLHAPDMYMEKLAVGPAAKGLVDIEASLEHNLRVVAHATGKKIEDVVAVILDRPRHQEMIERIRKAGARIKLISDGDVAGAFNTAFPETGVDIMFGSGGAPEGVLAAAALKCLGGEFQGRLLPQNNEEMERCLSMGLDDPTRVLRMNDLVRTDEAMFAATGVTDGEVLRGVRFLAGDIATTHTLVMRSSSGTIRFIETRHKLQQKPNLVMI